MTAADADIIAVHTVRKGRAKMGVLQRAARWPDDPQRTLEPKGQPLLIAVTVGSGCGWAQRHGKAIDEQGLMCSSHHGQLQFFHAQDDYGGLEPARQATVESRAKMLDWARFLYRVATDPAVQAMTLCQAMDPANDVVPARIRPMLTLANPGNCRIAQPYTVARLFSWQCRGPLGHRCYDLSLTGGAPVASTAAEGALLHLIQDSFSQSHAARVAVSPAPPNGPFRPVVECLPISRFYDYNKQRSSRHGAADKPPILAPSCFAPQRAVDDVITASAEAMWFVRKGRGAASADARRGTEEELVGYLEARVLRLA